MAWQWACLVCNETWEQTSPAAHRCRTPAPEREVLRGFWAAILRWSPTLRDKSIDQVHQLLSRPINRGLLVVLLGASWDPAGDGAARLPINAPRELAL